MPWKLRCTVAGVGSGDPFVGLLLGPGFDALKAGLEEAHDKPMATEGQGGSIPLCQVFQDTFPDAEIVLYGVEEPKCLIHAPNQSVAPSETEHLALAEASFLQKYGASGR